MRQILIGIGTLFCFSCGTETSEIGVDFFREGLLDVSYIDTVSVNLSTIHYNRIATSGIGAMLIGSNDDPKLGRISAASFVQFNGTTEDIEEVDATFDYLALTLSYNDYFYYDTTALLTLNVHSLTKTMESDEGGSLYNTSNFPFATNTIGSVSLKPHPTKDDSVEIKLSAELGLEFFEKAKAGDAALTNPDFLRYFKGVVIVPDTTISSSIIDFTASPELRLYYWDKSVVPAVHKYMSFPASGVYFTKITTSRINAKLGSLLDERKKVNSSETSDESYIQGGAGLALRVDIPYLRELKQLENFYVTAALLDVYVVKKSFDGARPLASSLASYRVNATNTILGELSNSAVLIEDTELGRYTRYSIDATTFVKAQMDRQEFNEDALLFRLSNLASSVNRICLAAPGYEYKTKLRIYYATVNTK